VTSSEGANQKGKRISAETPPMRGLDGPVREVSACGDSEASGACLAKGRVGRKVSRVESEEKKFLN
jgi:hypothetical protein